MMQFVVLGYGGLVPGGLVLSSADAATTVRDGALTPGALSDGLSSVAVLDAPDLDAVTESLRGLAGAFEVRPAEPR
ncbi:hypothetical protein [Cellulomonas rhizosphaerae]|uniref:Uncharacterized protein n=1 Tax=Cellulomonas rhizosphaerae TaxID=2293719 RepID=A0A413RNS7_9CELL|nr:hypothetical protein [Cellulomonas rhizosphaerae]RHA43578.1 hypothetical protein D1825_05655 [Cellulomonas rhizosphaerae]